MRAPRERRSARRHPMPASDIAAIEAVLQTYLDGLHEAMRTSSTPPSTPAAHLYSDKDGVVQDLPRDKWLDWVRGRGSPRGDGPRARRPGADARPLGARDRAGQGRLPDPAALLHRLPGVSQDRAAGRSSARCSAPTCASRPDRPAFRAPASPPRRGMPVCGDGRCAEDQGRRAWRRPWLRGACPPHRTEGALRLLSFRELSA